MKEIKRMYDERIKYNRRYYVENKEAILNQLLTKEECILCGRIVNHQNIKKHQNTNFCKKRGVIKNM